MEYTEIYGNNQTYFLIKNIFNAETHITFSVKIKSGDFSGICSFCIGKDNLKLLIFNLDKMYNSLSGHLEINDDDSDAFILFKLEKLGHMNISGQIGGSQDDHFMKFEFSSDQTALLNLKNFFNNFELE